MTTETRPVSRTEARDVLAERRMLHRTLIAVAILIPISAVIFGALVFIATRIAGVPSGAPTLMGAAIGVLSGVFFGMWAGVVASVNDIEHIELEPVPDRDGDADHGDADA